MANVIEIVAAPADVEDSSILAARDQRINGFREIENNSKYNIIRGMITSRQNMKYNEHLTPVYLRAKEMFDTMVDEQNSQITYLQGILTHLDNILQEYTKPDGKGKGKGKGKGTSKGTDKFIEGIVQDKKKIGKLLIRMRKVLNKLNEIDTITNITTEMMDKYTPEDFIVYDDGDGDGHGDGDGEYADDSGEVNDDDNDANADEAEVLFLLHSKYDDDDEFENSGSGSESSSRSSGSGSGSESESDE
jgi:hypothetical protein